MKTKDSENNDKIKSLDELSNIVQENKENGKIVGLCHGVFDLMHPGHIKHFTSAKRECDILVVTLTQDKYVGKGPGRPFFNQHLRAESIAALDCVDYVAINEWPTAVETIKKIKPNLYIKGSEYAAPEQDITGAIYDEKDALEQVAGRTFFTNEMTFSSTELLNRFFDVFPDDLKQFLSVFRTKYTSSDIIDKIKALKDLKVLIIGDTIIDEYHYCKAMGKSPKENIISTRYVSEERFPGGVLACANHLAGFCENVHLVTCLGSADTKEDYILDSLRPNIEPKFFYRNDTCTVVKRRFVDPEFLTKTFEISFLDDYPLPDNVSREICDYLADSAANYDLVVITDFGHSFINREIIDVLSREAKFLTVNAQSNSANYGYNLITKYTRADYICIDEPEIRLAARDKHGAIKEIIKELSQKTGCARMVVTRGHLGAIAYDKDNGFYEIPAFSNRIVDRIGAGDAFLSVSAPVVTAGNPMDMVAFVGNTAGAIAVSIVCNRAPIEPISLYKFLTTLLK